jgi:uncharacterized membrane protein
LVNEQPRGLERFSFEYQILQDKIDKIGAFRFTIRGWSVTLVAATIFTFDSKASMPPKGLFLLGLFVLSFFLLEHKQNTLQGLYQDRVFQIEKELWRISRTDADPSDSSEGLAPRIAHMLSRTGKRRSKNWCLRTVSWIVAIERLFYLIQLVVIFVAATVLVQPKPKDPQNVEPVSIFEYHKEVAPNSAQAEGKRKP